MKKLLFLCVLWILAAVLLTSCTSIGSKPDWFGRIAVLGDSISTFEGTSKEDYAFYYTKEGNNGVLTPEQTWWQLAAKEGDGEVVANSSVSGASIARITYDGDYQVYTSFPERLQKDINLSEADTLFIFGGTNDSWAESPVGQVKYKDFTEEDLSQTLPSYCFMLHYIKTNAPSVRVISLINTGIKEEIAEGIREASRHYRMECITLHDIAKRDGHPTAKGMEQIKNQIIEHCFGKS